MGQQTHHGLAFEQLYSRYSLSKHPHHSCLWDLRHQNSAEPFMMLEANFSGQSEFIKRKEQINQRTQLWHEHYLHPVQFYQQIDEDFCSNSYRLGIVYEITDLTLHQEINTRQKNQHFFEEKEIWSILCSLAVALSFLNSHKLHHLRITPHSIFIASDGKIKLLDGELAEVLTPLDQQYFPPEGLTGQSKSRVDVFSLGMSILHAGLLQSCSDCFSDHSVNHYLLSFRLKKLSKIYSDTFCRLIGTMLELDVKARPSIKELQGNLNDILSKLEQEESECFQQSNQPKMSAAPMPEKTPLSMGSSQRNSVDHPLIPIGDPYVPITKPVVTNSYYQYEQKENIYCRKDSDIEKSKWQTQQLQPKEGQLYTDPQLLKMIQGTLREQRSRKSSRS